MIRSFRSRALRRFMERGDARRLPPEHLDTVRDILARLNASTPQRLNASAAPDDMDVPGFRLHRLKGDIAGFRAVDGTCQLAHRLPLRGRPRRRRRLPRLPLEGTAMLMHDPPHPGAFIRRQCLEPLGLAVTEAAKGLAVSRNTLLMLLNGRLGISPEMAIRLSQAFGGSPESWLQQQLQYDLWHTQ